MEEIEVIFSLIGEDIDDDLVFSLNDFLKPWFYC
jgi:hypothetical protein